MCDRIQEANSPLHTQPLAGRTALVTGASSGLGQHFAGVLIAAGAKVVLAARRMERLTAVQAQLEAAGGQAVAVAVACADHPMQAHWADSRAIQSRGQSADAYEGIASFLQKRPAVFHDRVSVDLANIFPTWKEAPFA